MKVPSRFLFDPSMPWLVLCLATLLVSCRTSEREFRVVPQVDPYGPRRAYYSPRSVDDRLLVLDADGAVGIWDLAHPVRLFAVLRARAIDAAFSVDGRHIATVSVDGRVRWWGADGKLEWTSETGHQGAARAVAVSSDLIATGGEDGALRLWKLDGTPLGAPLGAHDNPVVSVDVSARGDLVSLGGDEAVRLFKRSARNDASDVPDYEAIVLYQPEERRYGANFLNLLRFDVTWGWDHSVEFSPSGELIAGALFDGSVRLWDRDGSSRAVVEDAHSRRPVRSLSFSPSGDVLASAGFDGTVRLWDPAGRPAGKPINAHQGPAYSVSFSPDGKRLATTGRDDRVRGWHLDGRAGFSLSVGHRSSVSTVALPAEAPLLALADQEGGVSTFAFDGRRQATLEHGGKKPIRALAFDPDEGTIVVGGADGLVWRWSRDGEPLGPALEAQGRVSVLAFDPKGTTLAIGTRPFQLWKGRQRLWQQQLRSLDEVISIAFPSSGSFIVTGSLLGDLQVWGPDGESRAHRPKKGIEWVGALAMNPAGDSFMAALGATQTVIQEYDLDLSPRGEPFDGHLGGITGLTFSPDGRFVAGGEDGKVRFWTLPAREVETIDVGLPIDQLGFWRDLLWVRAAGEWLFFYETNGTLVASLLLDPDAILALTPDGWYSTTSPPSRLINVYDASGTQLPLPKALARRSPERVVDAVVDRVGAARGPNGAAIQQPPG